MKTSESMINISKALVEAHKKIGHAKKDAKNPHFKNDYATLESVIDASKHSLLENGIIVIQSISEKYLTTRLQHTSGEFIESSIELLVDRSNMQGLGSAVTYARRYSLASMLNIAQSDDDGNEASIGATQQKTEFKRDPFYFEAGKFNGKRFDEIMPEDFDAELHKYIGTNPKSKKLSELIERMQQFKQQKGG